MPVPTSELQKVNPSAVIELFVLQLDSDLHGTNTGIPTANNETNIFRFHNGTDAVTTGVNAFSEIHWNGKVYARLPIQASGFEKGGTQNARPTLTVSNLFGTFSTILANVNTTTKGNDLTGATLTRIRTLLRYLPNDNFTGNNPYGTPDNTQEFDQDIFSVNRKALESRDMCQFELANSIDQQGVKLPKRRFLPDEFKGIGDFFN